MRPASQSLQHRTHPPDSEGDQYNVVLTVFTVGYIVGLIPNNLALQYFPYVQVFERRDLSDNDLRPVRESGCPS